MTPRPPAQEARHLLISGRVQGVCFRHHMVQEARRLGVAGWVRNKPEGRVEALIVGNAAAVAELMAWTQQGPPAARVAHIAVAIPDATAASAAQAAQPFEQRTDA